MEGYFTFFLRFFPFSLLFFFFFCFWVCFPSRKDILYTQKKKRGVVETIKKKNQKKNWNKIMGVSLCLFSFPFLFFGGVGFGIFTCL